MIRMGDIIKENDEFYKGGLNNKGEYEGYGI